MQRPHTAGSGLGKIPVHPRYGSNYVSFQVRPRGQQVSLSQMSVKKGVSGRLSRGSMLADIFMVVIWGATIPGLMWLGAAGGF